MFKSLFTISDEQAMWRVQTQDDHAAFALLVERWSARRMISITMIAWGSLTVLTALVHTPSQLYIARFILGAAEAGFFPGSEELRVDADEKILDLHPNTLRSRMKKLGITRSAPENA